ncbi:MAG TPA: MASE1 domain-containing protein [Polyangiaceae bacterium]|nr:MASE1 domain-containing protein [Polyangiaceae bacterium]
MAVKVEESAEAQGKPLSTVRVASKPLPWALWLLVTSCAYLAAARIGTGLHLPSNQIAIAWPASGVALAAFQLADLRRWWLLALGIGAANMAANWDVGTHLDAAALATVADLLEAMGGALVLRQFARGQPLDMTFVRHVLALCLVAVLVTPLCAIVGTAIPSGNGATPFLERWRQWTIVDGVGIIFVAPAILSVAQRFSARQWPTGRKLLEFVFLFGATIATTWVAISPDMSSPGSAWTSRYLVFPWLAVSALRTGPPGASLTAFGMSSAAIATAVTTTGVLTHDIAASSVLALQIFISVATLTTLGISALEARRLRAHRELLRANRLLESRSAELEIEVRRRTESEARVAGLKDDLAGMIDSMPLALIAIDPEDVIGQWNRPAEVVLGIPGESALGRPAREVLAEFWPAVERVRAKHHPTGAVVSERLYLERAGNRRTFAVTFYPLARGHGGVVMIGDVTEQERLQEVIMQTEKMISLGGLAAGMAHEINNPLGIVAQAAQNVQRRTSGDLPANRAAADAAGISLSGLQVYLEARGILQFIDDIRAAAARAAIIVSNMLEFSRRSPSAKVAVNLVDVLDRALTLAASDFDLRKQYDFRRVQIVREYSPTLPPVQGVVIELEQVFLNLIKNAAQAMAIGKQSEPRLTLTTSQEGKYAIVTVADNGPGMNDATRLRVFEPFFTTKEPGVGTGLGLSVSFSIITGNHKGTLSVRSTEGSGTVFTVGLPFAPEGPA